MTKQWYESQKKDELYGGKENETLNDLRFRLFEKSIIKSNFNLASLPPTFEALRQHCFRTYLQVQMWLGNEIDPLNWGWQATRHGLVPITTLKDAAPQSLLMCISCKCVKGCRSLCSCRKSGIKCSKICASCKGLSCFNASYENDDNIYRYGDNIDDQILQLNEEERFSRDVEETDSWYYY